MSRVYLAAPYASRDLCRVYAAELLDKGHVVTSQWIRADHEIREGVVDAAPDHSDAHLTLQTHADFADIESADIVILFTAAWCMINWELHRHQTISGGRHVEVGYALAKGKMVIVLGQPENIFHRGACVLAETWEEVLGLLYDDNGVGGAT